MIFEAVNILSTGSARVMCTYYIGCSTILFYQSILGVCLVLRYRFR